MTTTLRGIVPHRSWRDEWVSVLFHHITDEHSWRADDPLVAGLGVDTPLEAFESRIEELAQRYECVGIDGTVSPAPAHRKRVLVCFDDAYASVAQLAAPILRKHGVPWCFFVNPGLVGNTTVSMDNLACYVVNTAGLKPLSEVSGRLVSSLREFVTEVLPELNPQQRRQMRHRLTDLLGLDLGALAKQAQLYLEPEELRALADSGVEIGNHTSDHVHCRALDSTGAREQIRGSAEMLRSLTGQPVRAFAYPYGSDVDATAAAEAGIRAAGHEFAFLVMGQCNRPGDHPLRLCRVGGASGERASLRVQLDLLPRLRRVRGATRRGGRS